MSTFQNIWGNLPHFSELFQLFPSDIQSFILAFLVLLVVIALVKILIP